MAINPEDKIVRGADLSVVGVQVKDLVGIRGNTNGLGFLVFKESLIQSGTLPQTNTIYEIRYNHDLNGATLTIPTGCVLKFSGGSFNNGTLVGQDTKIEAPFVRIFGDTLSLTGVWDLPEFPVSWYGGEVNNSSIDISVVLGKIFQQLMAIFPGRNSTSGHPYGGAKVTLLEGNYYSYTTFYIYDYSPTSAGEGLNPMDGTAGCTIEGASKYGTIIFNSVTESDGFISNRKNGSHHRHWGLCIKNLTFIGGNVMKFVQPWHLRVEHCCFYNCSGGPTCIKVYATVDTYIYDCEFNNCTNAIEYDSALGGGGVSTTFLIDKCHISYCAYGFKLNSTRPIDGFQFFFRNTIFEYCQRSINLHSIATESIMVFEQCYFEGNPRKAVYDEIGNECIIDGVDCYFHNCYVDKTDYGFVKVGTRRFYWDGFMQPKLTLDSASASENVTIRANGKLLYENFDNHLLKTRGFFDETPGIFADSELKDSNTLHIRATDGDEYSEGFYVWDYTNGEYALDVDLGHTKNISSEIASHSRLVFSQSVVLPITMEMWMSGDRNVESTTPYLEKLTANFTSIPQEYYRPIKKLLSTLGAGVNSSLWQKVKRLFFPVFAVSGDGSKVAYDLISNSIKNPGTASTPSSGYTIFEGRGLAPSTAGGFAGYNTNGDIASIDAGNITFFGIVTYRGDGASFTDGGAYAFYHQGYRCFLHDDNVAFSNGAGEFGHINYDSYETVTPIAVAISKNVDGKRIVCMNDKYITYPETPNKPSPTQTTYMINGAGAGNESYTTTSVLGLCDGLTKEEAHTISTALQIFAEEVNILGKPLAG